MFNGITVGAESETSHYTRKTYMSKLDLSSIGGYECTFVDVPHEDDQCVICHLSPRDTQQTKCACAKLLCLSCYKTQRTVAGTCPTCRKRLNVFPDRNIDRRLKRLKVQCTSEGCSWVNELGWLNDHLGVCGYVKVDCTNGCSVACCRRDLTRHLEEECLLRQHVCERCEAKGKYVDMTGDHLNVCPGVIVGCVNKACQAHVTRRDLNDHLSECLKATVKCPYVEVGCDFVSLREAMEEHTTKATAHHLSLALAEISRLKHSLVKLQDRVCQMHYRIANVEQHIGTGDEWYSPGFYTHPGGYKLCLKVCIAGGTDGWVSVYLFLMAGENDDHLVWPLRYKCSISLLNQRRDGDHHKKDWRCDDSDDGCISVIGKGIGRGWGIPEFIQLGELDLQEDKDIQYLMDDCLYFEVEVKVLDMWKPWLRSINYVF